MMIGQNFLLTSVTKIWETLALGQGAQASYNFSKKLNSNHLIHFASECHQKTHTESRIPVADPLLAG